MLLRRWKESDAESLYKYASDERIGPAAGWKAHKSVDDSRSVIRDILAAPDNYAMTLRGTDEPIGSISVTNCRCEDHKEDPEIGCWVAAPYWGNGFATEALDALLDVCFDWKGSDRVWCAHFEGNEQSRRVIEKCGFEYSFSRETFVEPLGETRTERYYCISRKTWQKLREELQRRVEATYM